MPGFATGNSRTFPDDRIVEHCLRLNVFALYRAGALIEGAVTRLAWGEKSCQLARQTPDIVIAGIGKPQRVMVIWESPLPWICRPAFLCPICQRCCRNLHLRGDFFACRICLHLENRSRHARRTMPGLGRIEHLRRKIGADLRPFTELPPPPRRSARHDRIVAAIRAEEANLIGGLGRVVALVERSARYRGILPK